MVQQQQRSHIFCPSKGEQGKLWRYRNYLCLWQSCFQHCCPVPAWMWLHLGSDWLFHILSPCSAFPLNTEGRVLHVSSMTGACKCGNIGETSKPPTSTSGGQRLHLSHTSANPECVINFNNMLESHWQQWDSSMCLHACLDESLWR